MHIPVSLVLASVLGAQAAPSALPQVTAPVPDDMVTPVAVVKHTRKTVRHKTVTRHTVHRKHTTHAQSSSSTGTSSK
jgi:hypothetical protein